MAAKSSFVCLFQKKEEKMRLMSFRPPMQHFFQSSGIFTILLFLLFRPACGIRFLQRLRFGLPDATLDLSDFNSGKTKAHVEFTLCHVVARRPIRHFSPVNLCPSYARANSARACSDCLKQLSCMLLLWRFD